MSRGKPRTQPKIKPESTDPVDVGITRVAETLRVCAELLEDDPAIIQFSDGQTRPIPVITSQQRDITAKPDLLQVREALPVDEIAMYLQQITGRADPVSEMEINAAADLLNEIMRATNPAEVVEEKLEKVDSLLPALVELNIRQAQADGRPDLAQALRALQVNLYLQLNLNQVSSIPLPPIEKPSEPARVVDGTALARVLVLARAEQYSRRVASAIEGLKSLGYAVERREETGADLEGYDVAILSEPHRSPQILESMARCSALHIPTILDLESDVEEMPLTDPAYSTMGLGTVKNARAFMAAVVLADLITTPGDYLTGQMLQMGRNAVTIPDAWCESDELWEKRIFTRSTLNLGISANYGTVDDIMPLRRILVRTMREFPQVYIVVYGDPEVYNIFEGLPEQRKMFIPEMAPEDYPYLLDQMDVILAPLRNIPFNRSRSDRLLMEAGIKEIPWIASPMPDFIKWGSGGLIANSMDEWHTYLRQVVLEPDLRTALAHEGRLKALQRESKRVASIWAEALQSLGVGKKS